MILRSICLLSLACAVGADGQSTAPAEVTGQGFAGYISTNFTVPPAGYVSGFSYYATAWPLLQQPLASFQSGLAATWWMPHNRGYSGNSTLCPAWTLANTAGWGKERGGDYEDIFQTIEGGLGWWGSTRFPAATPKYRMNGTPDCYTRQISSPGWSFGGLTALPDKMTGLVQISNRILVPPDGLPLQPGTNGQLVGIGWMAMPFTDPAYYFQLTNAFLQSKNYCLDSNNPGSSVFRGGAYMAPCGGDQQLWEMVPTSQPYFELRSRATQGTNLCLTGNTGMSSEPHDGAAYMAACIGSAGQLWMYSPAASPDTVYLQTLQSQPLNLCLEGADGTTSPSFMVSCGQSGTLWIPRIQQTGPNLPVGNKSWTQYLNSANFKGPVAYYAPDLWTAVAADNPVAMGRTMDFLSTFTDTGSIEVNTVPALLITDANGKVFSRIPRLQFPVDSSGKTVMMQDYVFYSPASWFDRVEAWFMGGRAPGTFDLTATWKPPDCRPVGAAGGFTGFTQFTSATDNTPVPLAGFDSVVRIAMHDQNTCKWGLQWSGAQQMTPDGMAVFPEYYMQTGNTRTAVAASQVPPALIDAKFEPAPAPSEFYTSPSDATSTAWTSPGPTKGPFQVRLSDGSIVTYSWYKFIDQPSLQRLNLTAASKAQLQQRVEKLQGNSPIDRDYLAPPSSGTLASLDSALLVTPPAGLEIGYVPIVTRQGPSGPVITAVQDAESKRTSIVSGQWTAIYGANLSNTAPRIWNSRDFTSGVNPGSPLPAALDGVSASVGGQPAAVYYISPGQIDVLAPNLPAGTADVVITNNGAVSNRLQVTVTQSSPSFFSYQAGPNLFAAAVHISGALVGDPAISGPAVEKAHPGEVILLFASGLAPSPAGVVVSPAPFTPAVTVTAGSNKLNVLGAALVSAGEFQVNVQLPTNIAPGTYALTLTVPNGSTSTAGATVLLPVGP